MIARRSLAAWADSRCPRRRRSSTEPPAAATATQRCSRSIRSHAGALPAASSGVLGTPMSRPNRTRQTALSPVDRGACLNTSSLMPKMKSHSGAKKRFRKTGSGKLRARHAMTSHILEKKNAKRKRRLGRPADIAKADEARVRELLR